MPAYVLFDINVTDPQLYEEYKRLASPAIAAWGGKYRVRGGASEVLEGDWPHSRIVILEFKDTDTAKRWLDSPEYRQSRLLRHQSAQSKVLVVEGV